MDGKKYFCQVGFFRGKNRFLPPFGKNLPTLALNSVNGPRFNSHAGQTVAVLDKTVHITTSLSPCSSMVLAARLGSKLARL